jgi:hypothetical protein
MLVWRFYDCKANGKEMLLWRYQPATAHIHSVAGVWFARVYFNTPRSFSWVKACKVFDYYLSCTPRDVFYQDCQRNNEAAERIEMSGHDLLEQASLCRMLQYFSLYEPTSPI